MRRLLAVLLLVAFSTVLSYGQAQEWKKYTNEEGKFSVLLPGTPTDMPNPSDDKVKSHVIMSMTDGMAYSIVYVLMAEPQPVDEPTFTVFRDGVLKSMPTCTKVGEARPAPAIGGFMGRYYTLSCEFDGVKMTFAGNLYWGKHQAYAVMAMYKASADAPATVPKFLESFAPVEAEKVAAAAK